LREELSKAIRKLEEKEANNDEGQVQEHLQARLSDAYEELEQFQSELARAAEEIEARDKTIRDLKRTVAALVSERKGTGSADKEIEREMIRLSTENDKLRQHMSQLQKVFQEREAELISEVTKLASQNEDLLSGK
jgi:ABC-type transporter Mla subunit MlaD